MSLWSNGDQVALLVWQKSVLECTTPFSLNPGETERLSEHLMNMH